MEKSRNRNFENKINYCDRDVNKDKYRIFKKDSEQIFYLWEWSI